MEVTEVTLHKSDITLISTDTLNEDVDALKESILACKKAMAEGYTHYKGHTIGWLLSAYTIIKRDIESELARRLNS